MHIMIDLETMGTGSDAAIVSVGVVAFDAAGIHDEMYSAVDLHTCLAKGLTVDASTIYWWLQQSDKARGEIYQNMDRTKMDENSDVHQYILGCHLDNVLFKIQYLMAKVGFDKQDRDSGIWGNGASFDLAILANAYKTEPCELPWNYFQERCFRTIKAYLPTVDIPDEDVPHKAISDARWQARYLIESMKQGGYEL